MYFIRNLCFLCLSNDKKLTPKCSLSSSIQEIFGYVIPNNAFQDPDIPSQICDNCLNNLKHICSFRQTCLKSVQIYKEYVNILKQKNESFKYPSIRIVDIFDEEICEISEDIQHDEYIESEDDFPEDIESDVSETDYYNSDTENNDKIGKFEVIEIIDIKEEINDELINEDLEGDFNLIIDENPNNSEIHKMIIDEKEDGYISTNVSNFDSQSISSDTKSTDGRKSVDPVERPYKCDVCRKSFNRSDNLLRHKRIHSQQKPHSCEICHKSFRDSFELKEHSRLHSGDRPFKCSLCDSQLTHPCTKPRDGREIIDTHKNPYKCDVCGKTFKRPFNLKIHYRVHSGVRPYTCEICDKSFKFSSNYHTHKRTHNSERQYICEICQKSFKTSFHMKRHRLTHRTV